MSIHFVSGLSKKIVFTLAFLLVTLRCAEDQWLTEAEGQIDSHELSSNSTLSATTTLDCSSCDYVVAEGDVQIDGRALGLSPGSLIGLDANILYKGLSFTNLLGTPEQPIIIRNCGGQVFIDGTGMGYGIKFSNSRYFRITGGETNDAYGIVVDNGHMGVNVGGLSTDCEVDHLEIKNSGFAGIMAKTDPNCDDATIRGNFLMENVMLHHNYIHDTGGEGIYAGNSWFTGMNTACGVRLPHEIHNISINHNRLQNTGWEAIQLGCATKGASIHNNTIENYGLVNKKTQNNGIQIGSGTGGLCYNNLIREGTGNGMIVMGLGDNVIFNNIIENAGNFGVFCDERESPGPGFKFLNNTIISPASDGIRIYAELVPMNVIVNNIIVNPGSYTTYVYPRSAEDAFVYKLSDDVSIEMVNNFFTSNLDSLQMVSASGAGYDLETSSPVIDKGGDITVYHPILTDFLGNARLSGAQYDIGAIEMFDGTTAPLNESPAVNAGSDQVVTLPDNVITLEGMATDPDGTITSYLWDKISGGVATLEGEQTHQLTAADLEAGLYTFRLTATDDRGSVASDDVQVTVVVKENVPPVADAGPNVVLAVPANSAVIQGAGTDSDGTIVSYKWTQYGGAPALLSGSETPLLSVTGLVEGKYYFRLTVEDDDGGTHADNVLLKIEPNESPVANAGPNLIIAAPTSSVVLAGTGTDADGKIVAYEWTQYGGLPATLSDAQSPTATASGLVSGRYYFRLTVTDDDGATHYDNMLVRVEEPAAP